MFCCLPCCLFSSPCSQTGQSCLPQSPAPHGLVLGNNIASTQPAVSATLMLYPVIFPNLFSYSLNLLASKPPLVLSTNNKLIGVIFVSFMRGGKPAFLHCLFIFLSILLSDVSCFFAPANANAPASPSPSHSLSPSSTPSRPLLHPPAPSLPPPPTVPVT